jgi:signal transduction histidine kinase
LLLGSLVTAGVVAGTCYGGFVETGSASRAVAGALGLGGIGLLLLRFRHPFAVLVAELALAGTIDLLVGSSDLATTARFVVVVALYVMGTRTDARGSVIGAAGSWSVLALTGLVGHRPVGEAASDLVLVVAVTAVAFYVRSHRALIDSYRDRAEQAEREQQWQTNRAVSEERVRIARELHDVVAHHVSLLVVQAGAVRESLPDTHPTRDVLDSMIEGGRHAMTELRDMLDALRLDGLPGMSAVDVLAPRSPQPDVDQIPDLVAGARAAGLDVALDIERLDVTRSLPPAVSLAAYRIVQESLTNVVKHAATSATRVRLVYAPHGFEVTVTNRTRTAAGLPPWPGPAEAPVSAVRFGSARGPGSAGAAGWASTAGYGLTGMRERVVLAHGELEAGPGPDGWTVAARFPTAGAWGSPAPSVNPDVTVR